jgi:hypothetical protein
MVAQRTRDRGQQERHSLEHMRAHLGVLAHLGQLVGVEPARLAQDAVLDADLAHVVQQRAQLELRQPLLVPFQLTAGGHRKNSHAIDVAAGIRVARLDGRGEQAHGGQVGILHLRSAHALGFVGAAQVASVGDELLLGALEGLGPRLNLAVRGGQRLVRHFQLTALLALLPVDAPQIVRVGKLLLDGDACRLAFPSHAVILLQW